MSSNGSASASYVRRDECVRIAGGNVDDAPGLLASIVGIGAHNSQSSLCTQSKFLMSEVEEIMILDSNMNTVAVHNKLSHPRYSVKKSADQMREELLRKRNDLQRRHDGQSQALLKKHEEERSSVENHSNFTDEEMEYVLMNVMEPMHQKQLRLMKERHQKEQAALMDLMFRSAFAADGGSQASSKSDEDKKMPGVSPTSSKSDEDRKMPHKKPDRKEPPENLSSRTSVSSELGTIEESSYATSSVDGTTVDDSSIGSSVSSNNNRSTPLSPVPESPNPEASQPIYRAIQEVKLNNPEFQLVDLDGQDMVPNKLWKNLFQAIETNQYVKQISLQDCGLTDEKVVPLLLSLVENDSLLAMNLSMNPQITDETGRLLIKVLNGRNERIYDIDLSETGISDQMKADIEGILMKRISVDVL
jgi:hypothetical protein